MSCGREPRRGGACLEWGGYPAVLAVKACARASPVLASARCAALTAPLRQGVSRVSASCRRTSNSKDISYEYPGQQSIERHIHGARDPKSRAQEHRTFRDGG